MKNPNGKTASNATNITVKTRIARFIFLLLLKSTSTEVHFFKCLYAVKHIRFEPCFFVFLCI